MKRVVLVILSVFTFSGLAFSQSLELDGTETQIAGSISQTEMSVYWDVVNTSDQTVSVRVSRTTGEFVDGSTNNFCWSGLCYGSGTDTSSVALLSDIAPGGTDDTFVGYYYHNGNEGCTYVTYCFFDYNNPDDEICQDVVYTVNCTVGVEDYAPVSGELSPVSPNPFSGTAKLTYSMDSKVDNARIVIYNMIGEEVKNIPVNNPQGLIILDSDDFESGVYFYSLVANNEILATKKMVVQ